MNVADFQQNKTMMRQHTHDFIKNTSKPRISRGGKVNNRSQKKEPSKRNPQSGVNVNLYFGGTGGRTSLNDVSQFQYVPQGMGIPIHMTMPQGMLPVIQLPQGLPQVANPVAPVPIMGNVSNVSGGMPLGGALGGALGNVSGAVPPQQNNNLNWLRPAMTDITDAFRDQYNILTDLRNQMNQNAPNQQAIRQQIIDTETNFTRLMMNTNLESLEIQREYFDGLNKDMGDSADNLRRQIAGDTRNALGYIRNDLNRSIQAQTGEVIDAGSRISQAMNQRLEELAGLANLNLTQGILALPLKRGGANNEKFNLQRESIITQLDNPNISDAQRKYLESALVALNEPSKKGNTEKRNDTDEEPNFNNSMGAAAGGNQRPTHAIEFSQRPSPLRTSMINIEPTASIIEKPIRQPKSLLMGKSMFEPSDENETTDNNTMADLSMTEPTIESESGSDKNERSKFKFLTDDSE